MYKIKVLLVLLSTLLTLLVVSQNRPFSEELQQLASYMTGSFSSAQQAAADTNFMDISLHMARIWSDRQDGIWLYVEQASAEKPDEPYRQRIYRLTEDVPGVFESKVFEIEDPGKFIGAWKSPEQMDVLHSDLLIERVGCSLFLVKNPDQSYSGFTRGKECVSSHRGATYAVSIAYINQLEMVTWERGFNNDGKQVWGSEHGGYVFKKVN